MYCIWKSTDLRSARGSCSSKFKFSISVGWSVFFCMLVRVPFVSITCLISCVRVVILQTTTAAPEKTNLTENSISIKFDQCCCLTFSKKVRSSWWPNYWYLFPSHSLSIHLRKLFCHDRHSTFLRSRENKWTTQHIFPRSMNMKQSQVFKWINVILPSLMECNVDTICLPFYPHCGPFFTHRPSSFTSEERMNWQHALFLNVE